MRRVLDNIYRFAVNRRDCCWDSSCFVAEIEWKRLGAQMCV